MSSTSPWFPGKCAQSVWIGSSLFAMCALAGLIAVGGFGEARYHLERTNNILRRWSCPVGGYVAGAGSNGDCLCLKCPPGFKCAGGFDPKRPCSFGNYQNRRGQNQCVPSPPGHHVPRRGASVPTKCGFGTYQPKTGQRSCVPASPGNVVPIMGSRNQVKCVAGLYQNLRGQRACKPAPPGTYVNYRGATRGTPCNFGSYNPLTGQKRCRPSSPGHYVDRRGRRRQSTCLKNTYQHCWGQVVCVPCDVGMTARSGARTCSGGPLVQRAPPRPIRPPVSSCICPKIFRPVCGRDGKTYPNACVNGCARVGVACPGKCPCAQMTHPSGISGTPGSHSGPSHPVLIARPTCVCPKIYKPICGQDGKTYANACFAECGKTAAACQGTCPCLATAQEDKLME